MAVIVLFNTLRATTAPATEGPCNQGKAPTAEERLIWNWDKLRTKLEQNYDATNDHSNAEKDPKSSQDPSWETFRDTQNQSQHAPRAPLNEEKPHDALKLAKKDWGKSEERQKID